MRTVFSDPALQSEFEQNGVVKVPLLEARQLKALKQFYLDQKAATDILRPGVYDPKYAEFSIRYTTEPFKKAIFKYLTEKLAPATNKYLDRYQTLVCNYIIKEPNGLGAVPVHQNWALVDERKYSSVSVWCPLQDTDGENGTMEFVLGSHRTFRFKRGWGDHYFYKINDYIAENFMTAIDVKAGEALIFDDSIIHFSKPNQHNKPRMVAQLVMIPEEAQARYYCRDTNAKDSLVSELYIDENYFFDFDGQKGKEERAFLNDRFRAKHMVYDEKGFELQLNSEA